jgi:hydrogenase nickel incorporation protein HypA/HybF
MHELALAESIIALVEEAARRHGAESVTTIRLEIGALSCIDIDALRFCFDAVARGGVAESAELAIDRTPGEAWCMPCGECVPMTALGDPCPSCGSHQLQVTRGDAMRVKDIEIASIVC